MVISASTADAVHAAADAAAARDAIPHAILLLGPTACGKSELALRLARAVALEIIVVDSAQVYRGLDIGTAKPTAAERAAVAHHLIDIRDPSESYSAAEFAADAARLIGAVRARGRLPLLVGGTMLYARALRTGLANLPSADPAVRARLNEQAAQLGWPALHARLAQVDPVTAARLSPNDSQRIQRALEVFELAGVPMSQRLAQPQPAGSPRSDPRVQLIALQPADRAMLHARIEQRFDAMLAAGFLDEARRLYERGDLSPDLPSMRSVGYRQAWQHLAAATSAAEFRAAAIAATRGLAKRQMTWLRSMQDATVIDPFAADCFDRLKALTRP